MSRPDQFGPNPIVRQEHTSDYTHGELAALIAPVLGIDAGEITEVALMIRLKSGLLSFGGSHGTQSAKELLVDCVISGVLNYQPDRRP